jgi:hypothetical protein
LVTETIEIPEDVNPAWLRKEVKRLIDDARLDHARGGLLQRVLVSDCALAQWIERDGVYRMVVRARCYGSVDIDQEFIGRGYADANWYGDRRRPVVMKGSQRRLIAKHSRGSGHCANGWCEEVFARWLRMRKITAITQEEYQRQTGSFLNLCRIKHYLTYHFREDWRGNDMALIAGKWAYLDDSQRAYCRKLDTIMQKAAEIEVKATRAAVEQPPSLPPTKEA